MKIYSIIFLLFIACKVQGQQVTYQETNCVPVIDSIMPPEQFWKQYEQYSCGTPGCMVLHIRLKPKYFVPKEDSCDVQKLEIQTLRLLNDSLTKKLQLLLEWQELACPIIENIGVVKTVNGYRLLVNKREMIKPAVRYYKRYKTEQ